MKAKRTVAGLGLSCISSLTGIGLLCMVLFVTPALADDRDWSDWKSLPRTDATLYEVVEQISFDPDKETGLIYRVAMASLMGIVRLGTPLCPTAALVTNPSAQTCTIIAIGNNKISLPPDPLPPGTDPRDFGKGDVWGDFAIVVNGPGNSSVHVPDYPILSGAFKGSMDLSPAILDKIPLGSIAGSFTIMEAEIPVPLQTLRFTGTFRMPVALDDIGRMRKYDRDRDEDTAFYLDDRGNFIRVRTKEHFLGFPLVRLELTFGDVLPNPAPAPVDPPASPAAPEPAPAEPSPLPSVP